MGGVNYYKKKLFASPGGGSGGGIASVVAGTNITVDNTDPSNPVINSSADDITVVANYSALPSVATVSGKFYWATASQGTKWLPGALGGTYYSAGLYCSNGVSWEFIDVPYNATQAEVNTGTNADKFVTPATLTSWTGNYWSKAGSVVDLTTDADQLVLTGPNAGTTGTFHIKAGDAVNQYIVLSEAAASPNSTFLTFKSTGGNAIAMGARFSAGAPLSYVFTNPSGEDLATINTTTGSLTLGIAGTRTGLFNLTGVTSGTVTIQPASAAGTWSLTLPTSGGTNKYALTTDGSGVSTWSQLDLTAGVTGALPATNGGTGQASYAVGDLLYASTTTALSKLADVAVGSYLRSGGVGTAPLWSTLILPNLATANQVVYATSSNTYGGSTDFTFASSGGLNIKTAAAASGVVVDRSSGSLDTTILLQQSADTKATLGIAGAANGILTGTTAGDTVLMCKALNRLYIASRPTGNVPYYEFGTNGNLGVGGASSSGTSAITIYSGGANTDTFLTGKSGGNGRFTLGVDGSSNLILRTQNSLDIRMGVGTNDTFRINSSNNIGIDVSPSARLTLPAGTTAANTAPLKFTSGTNLTTAVAGAMEYDGTNLFFTRSGTTRESVITANSVNSVSPTAPNRTITVVIDGVTLYISAKTTND